MRPEDPPTGERPKGQRRRCTEACSFTAHCANWIPSSSFGKKRGHRCEYSQCLMQRQRSVARYFHRCLCYASKLWARLHLPATAQEGCGRRILPRERGPRAREGAVQKRAVSLRIAPTGFLPAPSGKSGVTAVKYIYIYIYYIRGPMGPRGLTSPLCPKEEGEREREMFAFLRSVVLMQAVRVDWPKVKKSRTDTVLEEGSFPLPRTLSKERCLGLLWRCLLVR